MFCFSLSSTLCESGFPFFWFFFRSMLPRKDQMTEVTTLLADRLLFEAFHIHRSASSKASFVLISLLSASHHFPANGLSIQIIVISEMHHDVSANAAKGSSL